jgi:hypothetical protein
MGHIPYRDSKLTRILQNSLTGNAKIVVICTLNPTTSCADGVCCSPAWPQGLAS